MSESQRIHELEQRYRDNQHLNAPFLSPVAEGDANLTADHPNAALDTRVVDEVVAGLRGGNTHYVDVPGMGPVRGTLLAQLEGFGARGFEQATTMVTSSVQEARFLAIQTITGLGGSIAVPATLHPGAQSALGMRPLDIRTMESSADDGFLPTAAAVAKALEAGAEVVYLENPGRLSGATFGAGDVAAIVASVAAADAHLIVDEGLAPWADGFVSFGSDAASKGRLTLIGEALPGRGIEGLGIGFLATNEAHIGPITKLKQVMSICTNTPGQLAVQAASSDAAERRQALGAKLQESRAATVAAARSAGFEVVGGSTGSVLALRHPELAARKAALEAAGVHVVDGAGFGAAGTIRVSVTADGSSADALRRIV